MPREFVPADRERYRHGDLVDGERVCFDDAEWVDEMSVHAAEIAQEQAVDRREGR